MQKKKKKKKKKKKEEKDKTNQISSYNFPIFKLTFERLYLSVSNKQCLFHITDKTLFLHSIRKLQITLLAVDD
jgi:hypothetical protein